MANSNLSEWIKANEKLGYSDDKIKESLMKTGFSEKDAKQLIIEAKGKSKKNFNEIIISKGNKFMISLYVMCTLFALLLSLTVSLINKTFLINLIVLIVLIVSALQLKYVKPEKTDTMFNVFAGVILTFTTLNLLILPIFTQKINKIEYYFIFAAYFLTIGYIIDYLLQRKFQNKKKTIESKLKFTIALSIAMAISSAIFYLVKHLSTKFGAIAAKIMASGGSVGDSSLLSLLNSNTPNTPLLFFISMVSFNAVAIFHLIKIERKESKIISYYLVPVFVFLLLSVILKIMVANVIVPML